MLVRTRAVMTFPPYPPHHPGLQRKTPWNIFLARTCALYDHKLTNKVAGFTGRRLKFLVETTYLNGVQPQWMLSL